MRREFDLCLIRSRVFFKETAIYPHFECDKCVKEAETVNVTSKVCGRAHRPLPWRDGIDCSERRDRSPHWQGYGNEGQVDMYALRKRDKLSREVPCARVRFYQFVYA
jgi:hypothetical protein